MSDRARVPAIAETAAAVVGASQPPADDMVWHHLVAREGAHLLRCNAKTKAPRGAEWQKHGRDLRQIEEALESGEAIGIVPWSLGCVVLDVDVPKKDGKPRQGPDESAAIADERLNEAMEALGHPTPLATYRTRSGGLHVWLRCKDPGTNRKWTSLADRTTPLGDIKTRAGAIIPPGDGFRDILDGLGGEATLLRSVDALPKPHHPRVLTRIRAAVEAVRTAAAGERNDTLNREVFDLAKRRHLTASVEAELREAALAAGLLPQETSGTLESARSAGGASAGRSIAQDRREAAFSVVIPQFQGEHITLEPRYGSSSSLWHYGDSAWRPADTTVLDSAVRAALRRHMGEPDAPTVREAVTRIKQVTVPPGATKAPPVGRSWRLSTGETVDGTRFQNAIVGVSQRGVVRVSELERDIFSPVLPLPIPWTDEPGEAPLFDAFLEATLRGSSVPMDWMMAQIGRALCPELVKEDGKPLAPAAHRVAVLLSGPGRTGKGTLLRIVAALTGSADVADRIDSFGGRFGTSKLLRQRVVLIRDMQKIVRRTPELEVSLANVKSLIEHEPIAVEVKGVAEFPRLTWAGTVWMATNHLTPFTSDLADLESWRARLAIVRCTNTRPEDAREDGLAERIVDGEGPAIAARCVNAFAAMIRGEIEAVPAAVGLARDELLTRQLSPAADFVYETFVHDADAPKLRAAIVNELRGEWTSAEGGRPSSQQVNAELRNLGGWQGHDEKGSIWWGMGGAWAAVG